MVAEKCTRITGHLSGRNLEDCLVRVGACYAEGDGWATTQEQEKYGANGGA